LNGDIPAIDALKPDALILYYRLDRHLRPPSTGQGLPRRASVVASRRSGKTPASCERRLTLLNGLRIRHRRIQKRLAFACQVTSNSAYPNATAYRRRLGTAARPGIAWTSKAHRPRRATIVASLGPLTPPRGVPGHHEMAVRRATQRASMGCDARMLDRRKSSPDPPSRYEHHPARSERRRARSDVLPCRQRNSSR
jgi:hypothetical protein